MSENGLEASTRYYWELSRACNGHSTNVPVTVGDALDICNHLISHLNPIRPLSQYTISLSMALIAGKRKRRKPKLTPNNISHLKAVK